ncbi:MAG: hypothetical protein AAF713_22505 [Pseudomonadota bacterium]
MHIRGFKGFMWKLAPLLILLLGHAARSEPAPLPEKCGTDMVAEKEIRGFTFTTSVNFIDTNELDAIWYCVQNNDDEDLWMKWYAPDLFSWVPPGETASQAYYAYDEDPFFDNTCLEYGLLYDHVLVPTLVPKDKALVRVHNSSECHNQMPVGEQNSIDRVIDFLLSPPADSFDSIIQLFFRTELETGDVAFFRLEVSVNFEVVDEYSFSYFDYKITPLDDSINLQVGENLSANSVTLHVRRGEVIKNSVEPLTEEVRSASASSLVELVSDVSKSLFGEVVQPTAERKIQEDDFSEDLLVSAAEMDRVFVFGYNALQRFTIENVAVEILVGPGAVPVGRFYVPIKIPL